MKSSLEKYCLYVKDIQKTYSTESDFINGIIKESKFYCPSETRLLGSFIENHYSGEWFYIHSDNSKITTHDVLDFISRVEVIYRCNKYFSIKDFIGLYFYDLTEMPDTFIDWTTLLEHFKNEYEEVITFFFEEEYHAYLKRKLP